MTVSDLEKKYKDIQDESIELQRQLKPLFKRLRTLAKKSQKLGYKIDNDRTLYVEREGSFEPKDWNDGIMFRLNDFDYVSEAIVGIDNVLCNIKGAKFWRKGHKKMVKVRISTSPNSAVTIAIPDEVIKGLPTMDM